MIGDRPGRHLQDSTDFLHHLAFSQQLQHFTLSVGEACRDVNRDFYVLIAATKALAREVAKRGITANVVSPGLIDTDMTKDLPLAQLLQDELARLGRLEWLGEELGALGDARALTIEPEEAWRRIRGLHDLDPARARLARALGAWRERNAIEHDRPRGWILEDAVLREIVMQVPRTLESLAQLPDMPAGLVKRRGAELLACVEAAQVPDPPPATPGRARPDPAKAALVKKLSTVSQSVATELNLVPEVLATRRDLEQLADGRRDGALLNGWRRAILGERLLEAL